MSKTMFRLKVKDGGVLEGDCFLIQKLGIKFNREIKDSDIAINQIWCG